jgi:hypothetical protein
MERPTRRRRAPRRDPTSLAIEAPSQAHEAIDNSRIDPELFNINRAPHSSPEPTEPEPTEPEPAEPEFNSEAFDPPNTIYPPPESEADLGSSSVFDTIDTGAIAQPFTNWTVEMEALMYSTLCTEVQRGKRADNGFKKEAWLAVCKAILDTFQVTVTIDQCKSKADNQKAQWRDYNWLRNQSGFGINEATGLIEAGEGAWADVIKVS